MAEHVCDRLTEIRKKQQKDTLDQMGAQPEVNLGQKSNFGWAMNAVFDQ